MNIVKTFFTFVAIGIIALFLDGVVSFLVIVAGSFGKDMDGFDGIVITAGSFLCVMIIVSIAWVVTTVAVIIKKKVYTAAFHSSFWAFIVIAVYGYILSSEDRLFIFCMTFMGWVCTMGSIIIFRKHLKEVKI